MNALAQDLRFALRSLRKRPVFTVVAVLSIALGIGFNAAIFSGANALLFRPVEGVTEPDRVVEVGRTKRGQGFDTFGYRDFLDLRNGVAPMEHVAAWRTAPLSWGTDEGGERIHGMTVSPGYFPALGARAARGRLFGADEDTRGGPPVVVVSHRFWQERLGGAAAVVGSTLDINRTAFTVIGVAAEGFRGHIPMFDVDVWTPIARVELAEPTFDPGLYDRRDAVWLHVLGRLAEDESVKDADAAAKAVMARLAQDYPETHGDRSARVVPLGPVPGGGRSLVAGFFGVLLSLVGLILLITAANVAGMLLARAASREREIAIRLALGSGRGRLVRQLTAEAVVLFLIGGGAGTALGFVGARVLSGFSLPGPEPITIDVSADATVLLFALGLALVTGVVFGLIPALNASRPDLVPALKAEGRGGRRRGRLRRGLATGQVGLSLVLLVAAGLFLRALERAGDVDAGFEPDGVLVASVDLSLDGYAEVEGVAFQQRLVPALRSRAGFETAGLASDLPLDLASSGTPVWPEAVRDPETDGISAEFTIVSPGYFETLRIPVYRGRTLMPSDGASATPTVVINRAMAGRLWPGTDPVGERLRFGGPDAAPRTVVGVVADVKNQTLGETVDPMVYLPTAQYYRSDMYVVARGPGVTPGSLRQSILDLDPRLAVGTVQELEAVSGVGLLPQRVAAGLTAGMGGLALFLSVLGVYGVVAYSVVQRRREIGVRMAVGATRGSVLGLILRSGLRLALPGLVVGAALAFAATRLLRSFLFGVSPTDPITFAAVAGTLLVAVAAASGIPALRAARQDPVGSLRSE